MYPAGGMENINKEANLHTGFAFDQFNRFLCNHKDCILKMFLPGEKSHLKTICMVGNWTTEVIGSFPLHAVRFVAPMHTLNKGGLVQQKIDTLGLERIHQHFSGPHKALKTRLMLSRQLRFSWTLCWGLDPNKLCGSLLRDSHSHCIPALQFLLWSEILHMESCGATVTTDVWFLLWWQLVKFPRLQLCLLACGSDWITGTVQHSRHDCQRYLSPSSQTNNNVKIFARSIRVNVCLLSASINIVIDNALGPK